MKKIFNWKSFITMNEYDPSNTVHDSEPSISHTFGSHSNSNLKKGIDLGRALAEIQKEYEAANEAAEAIHKAHMNNV